MGPGVVRRSAPAFCTGVLHWRSASCGLASSRLSIRQPRRPVGKPNISIPCRSLRQLPVIRCSIRGQAPALDAPLHRSHAAYHTHSTQQLFWTVFQIYLSEIRSVNRLLPIAPVLDVLDVLDCQLAFRSCRHWLSCLHLPNRRNTISERPLRSEQNQFPGHCFPRCE